MLPASLDDELSPDELKKRMSAIRRARTARRAKSGIGPGIGESEYIPHFLLSDDPVVHLRNEIINLRNALVAALKPVTPAAPTATSATRATTANAAKVEPAAADIATIYHGEHSYSVGDALPVVVGEEEHKLLTAFATKRRAIGRAELEGKDHSITNAPRAVKRLTERYGGIFASAVKRPGKGKKGGGYFARVEETA